MITTHGDKEVIYGLIVVSSATAMVLFDPSASHSFISSAYVEDHKITALPMRKPMIVKSPRGEMKANRMCPKVCLDIKGVNFEANLIVLELMGIDVILGMVWLSTYKGVIKYAQRSVLLITLSGERIGYEGIQPAPEEYEIERFGLKEVNDVIGTHSKMGENLRVFNNEVWLEVQERFIQDHQDIEEAFKFAWIKRPQLSV